MQEFENIVTTKTLSSPQRNLVFLFNMYDFIV